MEILFFILLLFPCPILSGHRLERLTTSETSWGSNHSNDQEKPMTLLPFYSRNSATEFLENMRSGFMLQSKVYLRGKTRDTVQGL